ncbi:nitrilase-related carbon-nitrogen hydrolase [Phaeacidiphilus oryzae]|uniref:nitrilase-related carbon-nitrogen hydrolase n=1 Tax=Phaeacidiphilus oryzae TaxID=348818 RepID=UPI00055F3B38|nr:nitrilase-related carbon-nitrogen hydrolase [Phaeacidiphilus oryzae]
MTRIVCRQLAPRLGELAANQRRIVETLAEATAAGAEVIVLPELATSGYVFETEEELKACAITADDPLLGEWSAAIAGSASSSAVLVCGFAELGADGLLYNSAAVVDAGGTLAVYRKAHLWDREKLFFTPGSELPPVVETAFGRIGVMVCYDLEFPEFTRAVALAGADLLAIPTNWPWTDRPEGEHAPEVVIAQGTARINHLAIACCDRSGVERGTRWNEGTALIDPDGWLVAEAGPGADAEAAADLDLARSRDKSYNPRNDVLADRRTDLYPSGR